ncbi:MAG: hypothetical protein EON93_20075 [Burkholderiales bacterium]|nr:MAG: hypothetical protein EON93_20075 [Burkholderiales bacterium]
MASFSPEVLNRGLSATAWRMIAATILALTALALLVAVVTMVARTNDARDAALVREQHSWDVLFLTRSLDASLARAEAALGRYMLSGDRKTGTIYNDEWQRARAQLRQLERLTSDQQDQMPLVQRLNHLLPERQKELAGVVTYARMKKGMSAISLYYEAGESPNVRLISDTLGNIAKNERNRLGQRSEATFFSAERSKNFSSLL